jgi:hypothetical protein
VEWRSDVHAADWIAERVNPFGTDVGSVIPVGFEAYARIFHPVLLPDGQHERWRDIAERNGRTVHPEMQFHLIDTPRGEAPPAGYSGAGPSCGRLPLETRRALVERLQSITGPQDDVWLCAWEGYGDIDDQDVEARVELPARSYLLARGSLATALESAQEQWDQSANLWWPDDRAWFVTTEIDYAWTYLGGPAQLIDDVLRDPRIEALPAKTTDKPFYDSDLLNAVPAPAG